MKRKTLLIIFLVLLIPSFSFLVVFNDDGLRISASVSSINESNGSFTEYWVEAGGIGNGSSEINPSGNITYVLDTYDTTNTVIKVKEGIYDILTETFPLTIDKSNVTIEAVERREYTIIESNGSSKNIYEGEKYKGFLVKNNSVAIKGFIIKNCSACIFIQGGTEPLTDIFIEKNILLDNARGVHANQIKKVQIFNNSIWASSYSGIYLSGGEGGNILNYNNISNNPSGTGVLIHGSNDNIVINNTLNDNWRGIRIESVSNNNTIFGNEFMGNDAIGIEVIRGDNNTIAKNNITNTYNGGGIYVDENTGSGADDTVILLNNISNNNGFGIKIANSINNNITQNYITQNGLSDDNQIHIYNGNHTIIDRNIIETITNRWSVYLQYSHTNTILRNNITTNQHYAINITDNSRDNLAYKNNIINSSCNSTNGNYFNNSIIGNYWSSYSGSDSDGDHIGDNEYLIVGDIYDYLPAMESIHIMDVIDPSIGITSPSDGGAVCTNFSVEWNANDESEIFFYAINLDGHGWNFTDSENWDYFDIENGTYTLQTWVVDKGWNIDSDMISINIDDSPLMATIESPMDQIYRYNEIDINVTIEGVISPVDVIAEIVDQNTNISLTENIGDVYYKKNVSISDGNHTLRIYVNDTCGSLNDTETVSFTVDSTAPSITIESLGNTTFYSNFVDINATVVDNLFDVSTVVVIIDEIDNITLTNHIGNLYYLLDHYLDDGLHTIRFFANDSLGNSNFTEVVYFTVDTDTISITVNNPVASTYPYSLIEINATVICDSTINQVIAIVNGDIAMPIGLDNTHGDIYSSYYDFLEEGANNVIISANDIYGNNFTTSVINFIIDTLRPNWTIIPDYQILQVGDNLSCVAKAEDPSGVIYSINDTVNFQINSTTGVITNKIELAEGIYWLEIIAEDPYSHSTSLTIRITVESSGTTTEPSAIPGYSMILLFPVIAIFFLIIFIKKNKRVSL